MDWAIQGKFLVVIYEHILLQQYNFVNISHILLFLDMGGLVQWALYDPLTSKLFVLLRMYDCKYLLINYIAERYYNCLKDIN